MKAWTDMTDQERNDAQAAEACRCWHRFDQHTGDEGACTSPTVVVWHDGTTSPTPCSCEAFKYPDEG